MGQCPVLGRMMKYFYWLLAVTTTLSFGIADAKNSRQVQLESNNTYTRIILPLRRNTSFQVSEEIRHNSIQVELDSYYAIATNELNNEFQDRRVKSISLEKGETGNAKFTIKTNSLDTKHFVYFRPNPPSLVVDIWHAYKNAQKSKVKVQRKVAAKPKEKKQNNSKVDFVVKPLNFKNSIFYEFPSELPEFVYDGANFSTEKEPDPGAGWKWRKADRKKPGGTNFSLAAKLYERRQFALAIKAVEFARRDYPTSPYHLEMTYLEALAYRELAKVTKNESFFNLATEKLKELVLKQNKEGEYPPFSMKIRMFFAAEAFQQHRWLDAISEFEYVTSFGGREISTDDQEYAAILTAMAKSYLELRQFRRAERLLRNIDQKYAHTDLGHEALYRLGASLSYEKAYKKAIQAYHKALNKYPKLDKKFPDTYYRLAINYYQLGMYEKSKSAFEEFVKRHPSNTLAGLALVRLGEIAEAKSGNLNLARKYYVKAMERFPYTTSSKLAQTRLARLDIHREQDLDFTRSQLTKIVKDEHEALTIRTLARGVLINYALKAKDLEQAIEQSKKGMADLSGKFYTYFKNLYVKSLHMKWKSLVQANQYTKALNYYEKNRKWLDNIGDDKLFQLGEIFSGLGLYNTSYKYLEMFAESKTSKDGRYPSSKRLNRKLQSLKANSEFRSGDYKVAENLFADDTSIEGLAKRVESLQKLNRLTEAKQLALNSFEKFKSNSQHIPEATFNKSMIIFGNAVLVYHEKRKELEPKEQFLAKFLKENKSLDDSFLYEYADVLWSQRKFVKSVAEYKKALTDYPDSIRASRAKYRLGLAYIEVGDRKSAVKILTDLTSSSQNIWAESAKRELELIAWEDKYSFILGDSKPSGLDIL